jgi:excisionase family DNA binding protein
METTLTTTQAAELLGVNDSRIRQMIKDGELPAGHFGNARTIQRSDVEALLRQRQEASSGKRGRGRPAKVPPAAG